MPAKPKKTTRKTTKPGKRTPAHGRGKLNTGGTPGNKGGTGRPPSAIKEMWRQTLEGKKATNAQKRALEDDKHPNFMGMTKLATLYVVGLPSPQDPAKAGDGPSAVILDL